MYFTLNFNNTTGTVTLVATDIRSHDFDVNDKKRTWYIISPNHGKEIKDIILTQL